MDSYSFATFASMKNLILFGMKRLMSFLFMLTTGMIASAQDTIMFRNGRVEAANVVEIGLGKIKYKKYSNLDGPLYLLDEAEVDAIKYQNGVVETFEEMGLEEVEPVREGHVVFQAGPVVVDKTYRVNPATYPLSYRRDSPSGIAYDSRYISESEACSLLGNNYYVFLEHERRYRSGRVMWITGSALIVASLPTAFTAAVCDSRFARHLSLTELLTGFVLVPTGIVRFSSGKVSMKRVLKDFNLDHNAKSNGTVELRFGPMRNGLGMNLSF